LTTASCCQLTSIAPKATIVRAREELKTMLTSGLAQTPPMLDASVRR
jgi:hypothetical protein